MSSSIIVVLYTLGFITTMLWWIFHVKKIEESVITIGRILKCSLGFFMIWPLVGIVEIFEQIRVNYGFSIERFFNKPRF